jgi:hypothetical protein
MMKLWLVIGVVNEVVASVDPLTMELPPCQAWAAREKAAVVIDRGTGVKSEDVTFTCEWSVQRRGTKPISHPNS